MQVMNVNSWANFKAIVSDKALLIQYAEDSSTYYICAPEANALLWQITLVKDSGEDVTNFEANFKDAANKPLEYRSSDGLPKVASAKFVESLSFYLTGEVTQAELTADSTKYVKYHFDVPYTLSGVVAHWDGSNFGDYMDFEVGVYTDEEDEGTFISLSKFASKFKIMGTGHVTIDVPTVTTVPSTLNIGYGDMDVYVRIKAVNIGSNPSKVIVNLVGWK